MSDGTKLIAAMLLAGGVDAFRRVNDSLFEDDELPVYQFVRRHFRRYGQLPTLQTVQEELDMRFPRIDENLEYYIRRVYDRALHVTTVEHFTRLRDALSAFDMDTSREVIAQMHAAMRVSSPETDLRTLREAGEMVRARYDDVHARPGVTGIPTGLPTLDDITGGYQQSDLVSYVARLGVGKTYTLLGQANHAWMAGYSVLVVTMEMGIEQIARRAIAMQAGINPEYIRKGTMCAYSQRRLSRYIDNMAGADRFHLFAGAFSKNVSDIEVLMHELQPDAVYLDGAYILKPELQQGRRSAGRLEGVADVYDSLKRYTLTCNRPIINTTQFSRSAGKRGKDGSLETIGYTDAIGTHSSLVLSIKEGKPPYQESRRTLEFMKGREGEKGEIETYFEFSPMRHGEVPLDQQQAESSNLDWMGEDD